MNKDKELIRRRFAATFRQYNLLAHTQQDICAQLAGMLKDVPQPARALEIGTGTGFLTSRLADMFPGTHWYLNDIAEISREYLEPMLNGAMRDYVWGDAETVALPGGLNLVASASTAQWFDDLPAFIGRCAAATVQGGYLALSSFGPDNFAEIKEITGEGLSYYTLPQLEEMITGAGYEVLAGTQYTRRLRFGSPVEVLHHIKATGVNSLERKAWTKGRLAAFEATYRERFTMDGGVGLTYHPILITAMKK